MKSANWPLHYKHKYIKQSVFYCMYVQWNLSICNSIYNLLLLSDSERQTPFTNQEAYWYYSAETTCPTPVFTIFTPPLSEPPVMSTALRQIRLWPRAKSNSASNIGGGDGSQTESERTFNDQWVFWCRNAENERESVRRGFWREVRRWFSGVWNAAGIRRTLSSSTQCPHLPL